MRYSMPFVIRHFSVAHAGVPFAGCHQQSWAPKSTQHRLADRGRISWKRPCLQAPPATLAKTMQSGSVPPVESLPFNTVQGRCAVNSNTLVRMCFSLQL